MEAIKVARKVVEIVTNKQAGEIVLLDVRDIISFTDYLIICNGQSSRQINAIHDDVLLSLKKEGILPHHREGTVDSGWLLLDYGDLVINIFTPNERQYYNLDELWSNAKPVVRIP